jgi:hypothetical protein
VAQNVCRIAEYHRESGLPFAVEFDHNRQDGAAMSLIQDEYEEMRRLAAMSPEERFRLYRNPIQPQELPAPKPVVDTSPAFQDKERKERVSLNVHRGRHVSSNRGGHLVSGIDETTELLFHIFSAAAFKPGTVNRVSDRYEIYVTEQLGESEEDLLYALLTLGVRTVENSEKIVAVKPSKVLDSRGLDNQTRNRKAAQASLRKLFSATAFVKDLRTGWEDGIRLIRRIRVDKTSMFDVVLSDDLLALFDEPAFPVMLELRRKFRIRDAFRVMVRLQFYSAFRAGRPISLDRETLIQEVGWARLKQICPRNVIDRIKAELSEVGIRCSHSKDYSQFEFQKQN